MPEEIDRGGLEPKERPEAKLIRETLADIELQKGFWHVNPEGFVVEKEKDSPFQPQRTADKLKPVLSMYLDVVDEVPDKFFEQAKRAMRQFAVNNPKMYECWKNIDLALLFAQVRALIENPKFIEDPRCVGAIEELSALGRDSETPIEYYPFTDVNENRLKPGFGSRQLEILRQLRNSRVFKDKPESRMTEVLFGAIDLATRVASKSKILL